MNGRVWHQNRWVQIGLLVTLLAVGASWLITRKPRPPASAGKLDPKQIAKEEPPPPAYMLPTVPLPGRFPVADFTAPKFDLDKVEDRTAENRVKPGHWYDLVTSVMSNERDIQARLSMRMTSARGVTLPIYGTNRWLDARREISLPKGQWKRVETMAYVTPRSDERVTSATIRYDLEYGRSGGIIESQSQPTMLLEPHQYVLNVMDQKPARFRFLERLDCINGFDSVHWDRLGNSLMMMGTVANNQLYHCNFSKSDDLVFWPHTALAATTVAHVIWSDFDPLNLDESQQQAMVDWLHWGGNLIVDGPVALERLQGSFLVAYLPAELGERVDLRPEEVHSFLAPWAAIPPKLSAPIFGCRLRPVADAQSIGDGNLMYARGIGRGRVVATGFALSAADLLKWPCYSNFFNGAVLGKPGRRLLELDRNSSIGDEARAILDSASLFKDQTRLWFLNRDVQSDKGRFGRPSDPYGTLDSPNAVDAASTSAFGRPSDPYGTLDSVTQSSQSDNRGAWNDGSDIPHATATILRQRATIAPPSAEFVLKVLIGYLILLIPINWIVFRSMGKLEWAWVAAPTISILGALAITRLVAFDIGFTRAKDTIAVLELQPGYSRGHLGEYTALYSSLSTNFQLSFEQNDAFLLPLNMPAPDGPGFGGERLMEQSTLQPMTCSRGQTTEIENFAVRSNTAEFLHGERMVDVGGGIQLVQGDSDASWKIDNGSDLMLRQAVIVRQINDTTEAAVLEQLDAKSVSPELKFEPVQGVLAPQIAKCWRTSSVWPFDPALSVPLCAALNRWSDGPQVPHLIALTDRELSPMKCTPNPTRSVHATIVAASLKHALPKVRQDDPRLWSHYRQISAEAEELLEQEGDY